MIAQELEVSLHMAFVEARQARHEFITVEHLLLALLDNPTAAEVLRACAANIEDLRTHLKNFIADNTPVVPGTDEVDTQPTLGFQRVIQRAIMHVQSTSNGKKEVTGANVLVAIFGEEDLLEKWNDLIEINARYAQDWPVIDTQKDALPEADEFAKVEDKKDMLDPKPFEG